VATKRNTRYDTIISCFSIADSPLRNMSQIPVKCRPEFFTGFSVLIQLAHVLVKYLKAYHREIANKCT
jgi:hypothetical protein